MDIAADHRPLRACRRTDDRFRLARVTPAATDARALGKVRENARSVVERLPGISVVAVTKVTCGSPQVGRAMLAGASFLPMTILVIFVAPFAGRFSDRLGSRWLMASGMALVALSLYLFSRVGLHTTYAELLPAMIIGGIGMPMAMSPTTAAAMATVPVDKAGVGAGVLNSFRQVGGSLGIALLGAVMASRSSSVANAARASYDAAVRKAAAQGFHLPAPTAQAKQAIAHKAFVEGLHSALLVSAAIALSAVPVAIVLVRKRHHEHAEDSRPV